MSVKQQIEDLEHAVNSLKSNDLDFEHQIDIYQDTLKKVTELNNVVKELTQKVNHAEISTNES
jgi:exonuclease VII small subunit